MKLLTKSIRDRLLANGKAQDSVRGTENEIDFEPVVKLFNPCGGGTWLLTELDSEDPDIAFGLCDLGMGCAELGSVRISELESIRTRSALDTKAHAHGLRPRSMAGGRDRCVICAGLKVALQAHQRTSAPVPALRIPLRWSDA